MSTLHTPPLGLRRAAAADALPLSVLAAQVFCDTYATEGIRPDVAAEVSTVLSAAVFAQRLAMPAVQIVVAERDRALLAFVDLDAGTHCPVPGHDGLELLRLYVQRPFLRQGLGRRLLGQALQQAQQGGHGWLWLTAWVGNDRARAFWHAQGFQDVGATPYVIEGQAYENRVLVRPVPAG